MRHRPKGPTTPPTPPDNLCQPSAQVSCGACCGMYNVTHLSRRRVRGLLKARTAQFAEACDPRDPLTLMRYRQQREAQEVRGTFSDMLRNCAFLGYIEGDAPDPDAGTLAAERRVGCMLHPSRHDGYDARACGAYDSARVCEGFHCAPNAALHPEEKALIVAACAGDAYLYGLIVCDVPLVRELSRWVEEHAASPLAALTAHAPFIRACRAFFKLKADWPWRDPELLMPGMFVPSDAEARGPLDMSALDYAALGCPPSRFDLILRQLASAFDDEDDLRAAEALIWARLHDVIEAARAAGPPHAR